MDPTGTIIVPSSKVRFIVAQMALMRSMRCLRDKVNGELIFVRNKKCNDKCEVEVTPFFSPSLRHCLISSLCR